MKGGKKNSKKTLYYLTDQIARIRQERSANPKGQLLCLRWFLEFAFDPSQKGAASSVEQAVKAKPAKTQFDLEALEPRLLLAADPLLCAVAVSAHHEVQSAPTSAASEVAPAASPAAIATDPAAAVNDLFEGISEGEPVVSEPAAASPASVNCACAEQAPVSSNDTRKETTPLAAPPPEAPVA